MMNNRERLGKLPLVELLTMISDRTHECMYKILSGIDGEQKRSRCHKMQNCQACLSAYLNEGGEKKIPTKGIIPADSYRTDEDADKKGN